MVVNFKEYKTRWVKFGLCCKSGACGYTEVKCKSECTLSRS